MDGATDIAIVGATLVFAFAIAAALSAWSDRRFPGRALMALALSLGLFAYIHSQTPGGLTLEMVPEAFVLLVARIVN